tara:strand:- start:490 stop:666 length:177 start_codon:yes stop_codon:yes gene_type:complete
MFTLNSHAIDAFIQGERDGIIDESIDWIISTVLEQEIVTFCTSKGCVSFDVEDLAHES